MRWSDELINVINGTHQFKRKKEVATSSDDHAKEKINNGIFEGYNLKTIY